MPLASGTKLGPYEILSPLGAGGMGEVYRARDSKLNREVALKVLPAAMANDAERMARFQREAQVLASLNHPNIASIYGLEESGSIRALVMELVEGSTLAERISVAAVSDRRSGTGGEAAPRPHLFVVGGWAPPVSGTGAQRAPLQLDEALEIARQIAEALEYAHERNVIHRDLKPANVKITPEGAVKVLDFGLAKAIATEASGTNLANSPTISIAATQAGVILGTAAYMSPEQAKGKSVDRRTDIWAFGCVLYEILSGRQTFDGETVSDVLAAVIMKEPDWNAVPESTPASIRKLLKRCLEKDSKRRLQAIGEARISIQETLSGDAEVPAPPVGAVLEPALSGGPARPPKGAALRKLPWVLTGVLAVALILGAVLRVTAPQVPTRRTRHLTIVLPPALSISASDYPELSLSPDGSDLVFSARQGGKLQLYQRRMEELEAKPITGTDDGVAPFFSPDGGSVAFLKLTSSGDTPALRKITLKGGPVQSLCSGYNNYPGNWTGDGTIYFSNSHVGGLVRVAAAGGKCEDLTEPDQSHGEVGHMWPQVLPGEQSLLFNITRGFNADQAAIAVLSLKTGNRQTLIHNGTNPHYVPGGFLVFARDGSLMALPFDLASFKLSGSPVPVLENVMTNAETGAAQFSFARDGTMAYIAGNAEEPSRKVMLVDRDGKSQALTQNAGAYEDLDLSPDGRRIAMTVQAAAWNIWIYDIPRGTLTRFTFENDNRDPLWSRDGKYLVYTSFRNGKYGIYRKLADGSGPEELLLSDQNWVTANSFSPDGKEILYSVLSPETGSDVWILPLTGDGKPRPFVNTKFSESLPALSPDGHWLAYESDESGRSEIYVQQFPGPGGKWQISNEGGARPVWSRDFRELFYRNGSKLMAVPIETKPAFTPGAPHLLSEGDFFSSGHYYDVMPGSKKFIFIKEIEPPHGATQINVVLNWFDELKRLMAGQNN